MPRRPGSDYRKRSSGRSPPLGTTTGGTTWMPQTAVAGAFDLTGITCPSATTCFTVGMASTGFLGVVDRTTDGGSNWIAQKVPAGTEGVGASRVPRPSDALRPVAAPRMVRRS